MTNAPTYIALNAVPSLPPQTLPGGRDVTKQFQNRPLKQLMQRSPAAVTA